MNSPAGLDLPRPTPEVDDRDVSKPDQAPEKLLPSEVGKTESPGSAMPGPAAPIAAPAGPTGQLTPVATPSTTTPPVDDHSPAVADDVDLIEKEWVHKAKAIVARTRDDPHLQNKEMNKFKAGYIKKRYNKDIRVSED